MDKIFIGSDLKIKSRVNSFIQSVYNWMAIGLAITGALAYFISEHFFVPRGLFFILVIVQLAMVFTLSSRIQSLSATAAKSIFIIYAALNGVTLSWIFLIYTKTSIVSTFLICSLTFASASAYGMITKKDLTSAGGFLVMGLIGIIIASLVNLFFRSPMMAMIINYIGVIVFVGLTAWDTQKIKNMALSQPADLDGATIQKGAIFGALSLYLDFINLFIMLLNILGTRE